MILDPWEVRAALFSRRHTELRHALWRERPTLLVRTGRRPAWLRRLGLPETTASPPATLASLSGYPELRRFVGRPSERALRLALTLAEEVLDSNLYELLPQN